MREIRVIEVVSGLGLGGAEKALQSRLKYQPANFQTSILNLRPKIDFIQLSGYFKMASRDSKFFGFIPTLRHLMKEIEPTILIVRTPLDAIRFGLLKLFAPSSKWKLVFEAHSNFTSSKRLARPILGLFLRITKPQFDLVIAVSEDVKKGPLGSSGSNCVVAHLGADISDSNLTFDELQNPCLLFLGRLTEIKRPLVLLKALRELSVEMPLPHGLLVVVGDGNMRGLLEEFVEKNHLGGVVTFEGFQENVVPFLSQCTHLVSVSSNEGLPISFFEAKLAGMRIISTPSGGGSEIFDSFDYELRTFDLAELVEHLSLVLDEKITGTSRFEIANNASWMTAKNCSAAYYKVLEDLLEA